MSAVMDRRPVPQTCLGCGSNETRRHCARDTASCYWIVCRSCKGTSGYLHVADQADATRSLGDWRSVFLEQSGGVP